MANLISGISIWAAYGVLSAAGVILCSRMKAAQEDENAAKKTHFSVEDCPVCVYNQEKP